MSVDRLERINSLLRRVIAEGMFQIIRGGGPLGAGAYTVTGVSCGKDLRDATVRVSVFCDEAGKETAIRRLNAHAADFQRLVAREVRLKFTPRLLFQLDESIEKGDAVLAMLAKIESESKPLTENEQEV